MLPKEYKGENNSGCDLVMEWHKIINVESTIKAVAIHGSNLNVSVEEYFNKNVKYISRCAKDNKAILETTEINDKENSPYI